MNNLNVFKGFFKDNVFVTLSQLLIYAQGIILIPIIVKTTGTTVYGSYILVLYVVSLILGIPQSIIGFNCKRYLPSIVDNDSRRDLFYQQFLFNLLFIAVASLVILFVWPFFNNVIVKDGERTAAFFPILYLFAYITYSHAADYFRYTGRINYFNYATVILPYLNIGVILLMVLLLPNVSVNMLVLSQAFSLSAVGLPLVFKIYREIGCKLPKFDAVIFKKDMQVGWPLLVVFLTGFVINNSDRYIIAHFISASAVGCYNPAYSLGILVSFFPMASGVVLPTLLASSVDSKNIGDAHSAINYTIKGFLLIAIPFVAGCALFGEPLIRILTNEDIARNSHIVSPIIATAAIFYGLAIILKNPLMIEFETGDILKNSLIAAAVSFLFNIIAFQFVQSIVIAAFGCLLGYATMFGLMYSSLRKKWVVSIDQAFVLRILCATIMMVIFLKLLGVFWPVDGVSRSFLVVEIVSGVMVYLLSSYVVGVFRSPILKIILGRAN